MGRFGVPGFADCLPGVGRRGGIGGAFSGMSAPGGTGGGSPSGSFGTLGGPSLPLGGEKFLRAFFRSSGRSGNGPVLAGFSRRRSISSSSIFRRAGFLKTSRVSSSSFFGS